MDKQKIVTNRCYGGFGLSHEATVRYARRKGVELHWYWYDYLDDTVHTSPEVPNERTFIVFYGTVPPVPNYNPKYRLDQMMFPNEEQTYWHPDYERDDPDLIAVIEELGTEAASGTHAELQIDEIPSGVKWQIEEYDGYEHIAEEHRTW